MNEEFQRGPELVVRGDCAHFIPDEINPPQGMGECRIDYWKQTTGRASDFRLIPPWPWAARYCRKFKQQPAAEAA